MDVLGQLVQNTVNGLETEIYGEFVDKINEIDGEPTEAVQCTVPLNRICTPKNLALNDIEFEFHRRSKPWGSSRRESTGSSGSSESWLADQVKCEECPNTFASKNSLKRHVNKYHTKKEYECPVCQRGFQKSNVLQSHIQSIHPHLDMAKLEDPRRSHKEMKLWTLQKENFALKRKIDDLERYMKDDGGSAKESKTEIESIRKENKELEKTVAGLTECLHGKESELDKISLKCQKLENNLEGTAQQLTEQVRELSEVREENLKMKSEMAKLKEDNEIRRRKLLECLNQV